MTDYVIVGNGAAGVSAAETLRRLDRQARIVILTAERQRMYSRPGLAYVVMGEIPLQQVVARSAAWYAEQRIELIFARAESIAAGERSVQLSDGRRLRYDRLLLATGARAVPAPFAVDNLSGVVYLDTYDGTRQLLREARGGWLRRRRGVVIGGGVTALEMAEGFAAQGVDTHYFVRGDSLWRSVFNDAESALLADKIGHHGVTIHYNTEAVAAEGGWHGRLKRLQLKGGGAFDCNLLGVGIGVRPQLGPAESAGVAVDRAVLVDQFMQSSVAGIYAAGDCAQVYDRWSAKHLLDILWPSAVAEGEAAATNMAGVRRPYQKGTPFNVALLFGLHITAIGQVNPRPGEVEEKQALSRGSSELWYTFPRNYGSAWQKKGDSSLRLVLDGSRLVGALLIGEQTAADALRRLVDCEADVTPLLPYFESDRDLLQQQIVALAAAHA